MMCAIGLLAACADVPDAPPDCSEDRCDAAGSREELLAAIDGHADPIAEMLRAEATDRGTIAGDYQTVLDSLGEITGCAADTERSFVVLSNADFVPKMLFARCADEPQLASRFFVAVPSLDASRDMEPQALHLSAWDDEAGRYRHYATNPERDSGEMSVNVQPSFCLGCHGGPEKLGVWQPLMNEMTNPWSGWNAEPGFASNLFDEYLDGDTASGANYTAMTDPGRHDSASNLEPLVRAGVNRYVSARVLERNQAASLAAALDMVRPLFCDELVNYTSEIHESGELRTAALVDDGLRALLAQADPTLDYDWLHADTVRLIAPSAGDPPVSLIATRSESAVQTELALAARRVLEPSELLRARAIDWARPVASDQRCQIYRDGRARIEAGALDPTIAGLADGATTADLIRPVYTEILAGQPAVSATDLAAGVDAYLIGQTGAADRSALRAMRDERGCWAEGRYLSAPIIPDLSCQ